jgi:hypothetical protein
MDTWIEAMNTSCKFRDQKARLILEALVKKVNLAPYSQVVPTPGKHLGS